jgi:hypothetical protein
MSLLLERPDQEQTSITTARGLFEAGDRGRSIQVGLVLAIFVWFFLLFVFGVFARHLNEKAMLEAASLERPDPMFEVELEPEPPPEPPQPTQFVEVNPDAPENTPDNTRNFGAQNQQVAQEVPTPDGKSDRPATEGKPDHESNQIVSGELTPPEFAPPPAPPPTPEVMQGESAAQAQQEQNPLVGTERDVGESETGFGSQLADPSENPTDVPEKVEGQPDVSARSGASQIVVPRIDPTQPQPRPRLGPRARPAILAENKLGTDNIGPIAYDARWSPYGQYLQQLIETVQVQWERLLREARVMPPAGSQVTVKFILGKDGTIEEIVDVHGTGGTQYERICVLGITSRSPYGKWSEEMIAVLGERQELTFSFFIH